MKKEETLQQLIGCQHVLKYEFERLYEYQLSYFCLFNSYKDIINGSKSVTPFTELNSPMFTFCQKRNDFILNKLKIIKSYLLQIDKAINALDGLEKEEEMDLIKSQLTLMFISLGLGTDIFGEPF